jgi:hypothetical protein
MPQAMSHGKTDWRDKIDCYACRIADSLLGALFWFCTATNGAYCKNATYQSILPNTAFLWDRSKFRPYRCRVVLNLSSLTTTRLKSALSTSGTQPPSRLGPNSQLVWLISSHSIGPRHVCSYTTYNTISTHIRIRVHTLQLPQFLCARTGNEGPLSRRSRVKTR